jgi:NAD(P)-dependent dehydrogenase (short-subunit alcohol dehydrogenase family)
MQTIITGAEQGLGAALLADGLGATSRMVHNLPRQTLRSGKGAIDLWFARFAFDHPGSPITIVNNYGTNHLSWIGTTDWEDEAILQHNVLAPYWVVNAAVSHYGGGRIVNIASATYRVPQRCTTLYCASKAALVQMTRVMARELAPHWTVNAVAPGLIEDTQMAMLTTHQVCELRDWSPEQAAEYADKLVPMGRPTTTEEVTAVVRNVLAMPQYVTGAIIDVMGGV